jgi:hypothetical protein
MARLEITYWRDVPALVRARDGAGEVHRPLSPRFQELIDQVAMLDGLTGADAYLAGWRTEDAEEHPGPTGRAAEEVAATLEAAFEEIRSRALRRARPGDS